MMTGRDASLRGRWAIAIALAAVLAAAPAVAAAAGPVPVIFDTDMCGDCDDVAALAMLHALESREQCRLLAVTVSADHPRAAPFADAINRFYGRTEIPVGVVRPGGVAEQSVYLKLADATFDDPAFAGRERYPHSLRDAKDAPEAVAVLRKALAGAEDGSVVMIQVGFSTNLARLLASPPDDASPLDGRALVARKVRLLELMAGAFRPIDGNAAFEEYNVVKDRAAAAALAEAWPTEMIWSGFEIGIALPYPSPSNPGFPAPRAGPHFTASIRSSASTAKRAVSSSTRMTFTGLPASRCSRLQQRWARSMRYIVAHMQTTGERKCTSWPGWFAPRRRTRWSSVPMPHFVPGGACSTWRRM